MNTPDERVLALRGLMREWGWNAAVIVGEDPHNSEYTPSRWCQREFISGFTGSAGVVVITSDHAGLWVDSRYHIQAARELQGSGIELHKMISVEDAEWMKWIADNVPAGGKVGIDGICMSELDALQLQSLIATNGSSIISRPDFLGEIWPDRPSLPQDPVWLHAKIYSGRSTADKLSWFRSVLADRDCRYALVTTLDQIAWLLNIRSNDIAYCPVVISFAVVTPDAVALFADEVKFSPEVREALGSDGISVYPYDGVTGYIASLPADGKMMTDPSSLNYELAKAVNDRFGADGTVCCASPIDVEKSVKNAVEIEGFRQAYVQDGVAQTRFYHWLENAMAAGEQLSEADAADRLHEFRAICPDFLDESFETISAYQENSALPHYSTVRGQDALLQPHGLYLNDSGAHYRYGTTDITRTIALGPTTQLEREDYTLVLKGMIGLATAVFPRGTRGANIDVLARIPLWKALRNFGHGTGHGIGHVLCVHEGPQDLRQNVYDQAMLPGMVTSDEPGLYREGMHGVRHENVILCRELEKNEFGDWLGFETLTCTYIDPTPILPELMTDEEKAWLNHYNEYVYIRLLPYLDEDEKRWLRSKTIDAQL